MVSVYALCNRRKSIMYPLYVMIW